MANYDGSQSSARIYSPESTCFIFDQDSQDRVEFQLMPDTISESKNAVYNEVPILGRSLPLLGYSHSSSRQMGLSLQFVSLNRTGKYSPQWVLHQVRWLESKVYPAYDNGYAFPPPRLIVVVGNAIGMQCTMSSVSTTWLGPWTLDNQDGAAGVFAYRAQVDCQFTEFGENDSRGYPFDTTDAKNGDNQIYTDGTGSQYVDIPLSISVGGG
jgi:hypothetical protein